MLCVVAVLFGAAGTASAAVPYWDNGTGSEVNFPLAPWPTNAQWVDYMYRGADIKDQRTQDPSNGGTSPQAYVNVASGCNDQFLGSVFYYYDPVRKVIFYRWRVENAPNNYATGPSPGAYRPTNPWNSGQWSVLIDTNGDGYRDFAVHLNGSWGDPSQPIDYLAAIWSPTKSQSLDYVGDSANIHVVATNPTAFVQGNAGSTNNQILQFNGNAGLATVQWPNGASETVWDYGTTRAVDISTSTCREYFVDYQFPLAMLDATAFGGPKLTETTPFSFAFATANSLNDPFQKDVVFDGEYACDNAPGPFGDPLTLTGGQFVQPITTSLTAGAGSCTVPLTAQVLDSVIIEDCEAQPALDPGDPGKFVYWFDSNGDGLPNDAGSSWTDVPGTVTITGSTLSLNWNTNTVMRGQYLIAAELHGIDGADTRTYLPAAAGGFYPNAPVAGISSATQGVNYAKVVVAGSCGLPPPSMTKSANPTSVMAGGTTTYTLTITNNSTTSPMTVTSINDTLPVGFSYAGLPGTPPPPNYLGAPTTTPSNGATGTVTFTFPSISIPASGSRTFLFNVTTGSQPGRFYNTATVFTSLGNATATDSTGLQVQNAAMAITKSVSTPSVARGGTVTFTITYSNIAAAATSNVTITDVLPPGFLYQGASVLPTSAPPIGSNGTLVWNIGNVAGNSGPFTIAVTATATRAGPATNTANLTAAEILPLAASANLLVTGPRLVVTKTPSASTVVPVSNVDYTITYSNAGDSAANLTSIIDDPPNGFTFVSKVSGGGASTCLQSGGAGGLVTCNFPVPAALAAGTSSSIVLRFSVAATATDPSTNLVTVNANNADSATATATVSPVSASCGSGTNYYFDSTQIDPTTTTGEAVGYTRMTAIGNNYTTATVTFSAPPPGGTTATGTAVINDQHVVGITITNPGSGYVTAPTVTIGGNGTGATATATLTSTQYGTQTTAPIGTAVNTGTWEIPTTWIEVARFYSPVFSATDAYVLTNINDGASVLRAFVDKDGAPQLETRVRLYSYNPATNAATEIVTTLFGDITGNRTNHQIDIVNLGIPPGTIIPAGHRLLWVFEFQSENQENNVTFRFDGTASQAFARICATPTRPSLSKSVDKPIAVPGVDQLTYTISYSNPGSGTIPNVVISDTLPPGTTYVSASPAPTSAPAVGGTGTVTWNIGNLGAGISGTRTITVATTAGMSGTTVTNTASLSSSATSTIQASATTELREPDVRITKTASASNLVPGQAFSYSIIVTNVGNFQATGVEVRDTLPPYITSTSHGASPITINVGTLAAGASQTITINAVVNSTGVPAGSHTQINTAQVRDAYDTTYRNATATVTVTATPVLTLTETATPSARRVVYVDVTAGGTWTTIPTVSFTGGGCTGATGTVSVTGTPGNYTITGVTITNPGSGCTGTPSVVFSGTGGGATAVATVGPAPGDTITYVLTATNTGNATANDVVIYDRIPNYTNYVSGGTFLVDTVYSAPASIVPGGTAQLTYTVVVGASLPNGVTPLTTNGGATSSNAAPPAPVTTTVHTGAQPVYAIVKGPDDEVKPFPVTTLSAGATATNVVSVVSTRLVETGSYVAIGGTVAQVDSKTANSITLSVPVTAGSGSAVLQAVEYTIAYGNSGDAIGTNVVITDPLPANVVYGGTIPSYPAPTSAPAVGSNGTLTWNLGTLVNGASGIVKYLAYATAAGTYTNTATIADGTTLNTYNASDSATTTWGALDPQKSTSTPSIINQSPTNVATYTITIANPLATPATSVHAIDNLPLGFTYQPGSTLINGVSSADPTSRYIAGISITSGGTGYVTAPTVGFTGGGGTGATAKAIVVGGVVTSIVITNPGSGYTSAPSVTFTGGTPTAAATATTVISDPTTNPQWAGITIPANGTVTITFNANVGSGVPAGLYQNEILTYGSIPSLYFDYLGTTQEDVQVCVPPPIVSAPPACGGSTGNVASILNQPGSTVLWSITNGNGTITTATTGTIHQVSLGSGGSGYTIAPAVSFSGGGGTGAAAIATVSGGVITAITMTNPGSGYTSTPTVVITANGSGSGATAAAVLGTGIIYTAGANGTVELSVTVTREFSVSTPPCAVVSTKSVSIDPSPTITTGHPRDLTVCPNTLASFTVNAVNGTSYQWQVANSSSGPWTDITGATGANYAFTATVADNGKYYRVVVSRGTTSCAVASAAALLTVNCGPDLAVITNDDTPDPVTAGENITYTQEVRNISPTAATNPTFTQVVPAGTTFVSMTPPAGWSCTTPAVGSTGTTITCTANSGTLAGNTSSGAFTLVLASSSTLAEGATITETASVSMTEVDPSPSNNSRSAVTTVQRRVDAAVVKDSNAPVAPAPYAPLRYLYTGNPTTPTGLQYTINVTNNGPSRASQVVITDTIPPNFSYDHTAAPATASQGTCSFANGIVTCSLGQMDRDGTATITIPGTVNTSAVEIVNTAVAATPNETDTNLTNNSSSHTVNVVAPTEVKMFRQEAIQSKSGVTVMWQTSFESFNLGFNVYRSVNGGAMEKLNKHIIPGSGLVTGTTLRNGYSYRFKDKNPPAGAVQYFVEDVDMRGTYTMHPGMTPTLGSDDDVAGSPTDPDPGIGSSGGIVESPRGWGVDPQHAQAPLSSRLNEQWRIVASQPSAKVVVTRSGWVSVKKRDLVAAGYDPGSNSKTLAVFTDGMEIAIDVRDGGDNKFDLDDTIEFYGTGIDIPSAGGRVYFVATGRGQGSRLKSQNGAKKGTAAPASFPFTYTRKERFMFFSSMVTNGEIDNFYGAFVGPWGAYMPFTAENFDPAGAPAELEVVFQGVTANHDHVINMAVNGHALAPVKFRGRIRHVAKLSVPVSYLVNGTNALTFVSTNGDLDTSSVESLRITYPHLFKADDGALAFTVAGGTEVAVSGFADNNVFAVDLTNANDPIRLNVTVSNGTATVVAPDGGTRTIAVYNASRRAAPAQLVLNQPSTWNDTKNQADLVIVTNSAFIDAAKTLQKAREAQGIVTSVVDVQNVYDEFSFGVHGPQAIRDFLQRSQSWKRAPKYVVLLGDASSDPRNYMGHWFGWPSFDYVPTKLIPTQFIKTASDDWFADFNDTGVPSLSIGRIPVRTPAQANAVIAKLVNARTTTSTVTMVSDRPSGLNFEQGSNYVAANLPSALTASHIRIGQTSNVPGQIGTAFSNGSLLINYMGHGSTEVWSDVFSSYAASQLTNGNRLPFVVAMNCLNGMFHDFFQDALGEALLRNGNGGAVGVWASSAPTAPQVQTQMNAELFRQIFATPQPIGDAVRKAKASVTDKDVQRTFILFGDPTMVIK
ncbi:MAG TPA: C25 family cysteine peptidase [Thermoanaerobaculia bacterium]|nr:C25 family cysteine peptidase [Thermoanaerobaculia bacterium]